MILFSYTADTETYLIMKLYINVVYIAMFICNFSDFSGILFQKFQKQGSMELGSKKSNSLFFVPFVDLYMLFVVSLHFSLFIPR